MLVKQVRDPNHVHQESSYNSARLGRAHKRACQAGERSLSRYRHSLYHVNEDLILKVSENIQRFRGILLENLISLYKSLPDIVLGRFVSQFPSFGREQPGALSFRFDNKCFVCSYDFHAVYCSK